MGAIEKRTASMKANTLIRHERIKKRWEELLNEEEHGVRKYSLDYINTVVGAEFGLSAKRVYDIVTGNAERHQNKREEENKQLDLFNEESETQNP